MARKLTTALIITVIGLTLIVSCGSPSPTPTPKITSEPEIPAHFSTYTSEGLFSISYPPDWEPALSVMADLEQATKELLKSIDSDAPVEQFTAIFFGGIPTETGWMPNVVIGVESLSGIGLTLDEAVEMEVKGVKDIISDYHEFSRIDTTIDGREATILDWEGTYPELGENHGLQMFILVGKVVWMVSCTPETGKFNECEDDFHAIVRSLRILK